MRSLPAEVDQEILDLLLQGVAYREISRRFGISTSSVARVAADARKKAPDFDSLRSLSVLLKKARASVFDATRASRLLETLSIWGISLDKLGDYVQVNEKFLSERTLNENFLVYAVKLMQLEQVSGRTYQEAVEDLEKKVKEAAETEEKKLALENEALGLTVELRDTKKNLAKIRLEIADKLFVQKGLEEIGLRALSQLVRFVRDFEAMGFDPNQAKKVAIWRRELQKLRIDPDELDRYIAERGPLEAQNNRLRLANERIEADVNAHAVRRATLVAENTVLQAVDLILRTGILNMQCKSCGHPLPIWLPTQESFLNLTNTGQAVIFKCQNCGTPRSFTTWEIAFQIAWMILPTNVHE